MASAHLEHAPAVEMASSAMTLRKLAVHRAERLVVAPLDLTIHFGEVLAILGPNGAGKTTLLKAMAGLIPHVGVRCFGEDAAETLSVRERARRLAFVPQHSMLRAPMLVRDVVEQGRHVHRRGLGRLRGPDLAAVDEALHTADIEHLATHVFTQLSFGEQRRVLLARGLATGAPLLCLDEPTASLDLRHALDLYRLMRRLARAGRAVVVVLHQLDDALQHTDRTLLLSEGQAVAQGPTKEVLTQATIESVYGVRMEPDAGLRFSIPGPA